MATSERKKLYMKQYNKDKKEAISLNKKAYGQLNKKAIADQKKKYKANNQEKLSETWKQYRQSNKGLLAKKRKAQLPEAKAKTAAAKNKYYQQNKLEIAERSKANYRANKDKAVAKAISYRVKRKAIDPLYKLIANVRNLVRKAIQARGWHKTSKTTKLLGCSFEEFQQHIGTKPSPSHQIDHICPCAQATTEEELILLQHYSNLQWLDSAKNIAKSDSRTPRGEEICLQILGRQWLD